MKAIQLLLALVGFSCAWNASGQASIAERQDAEVLANLRNVGADLSKPHDIDFFLIFETKTEATAAARKVQELGFKLVGIKVSVDKQWQVHVKQQLVPTLPALNEITRKFEKLSAQHGGYYDGWGTIPVR